MKNIIVLIAIALALFICHRGVAQTMNWRAQEASTHIIHAGFGWDYGASYQLGYGYQLKEKVPMVLAADFSAPLGKQLWDDVKTQIGLHIVVLDQPQWKGVVTMNGIYRRFENPLVRLQNFGSELKGSFGYYRDRWFVAGEFGFDKAIVTHFKHSQIYRETIYGEVEDGWFEPPTGGHFSYGIQTGYSFHQSDLTLNLGKVVTEDFQSTPLIPFYLMLGFNYRLD